MQISKRLLIFGVVVLVGFLGCSNVVKPGTSGNTPGEGDNSSPAISTRLLTGTTPPANATGADGDLYLNTSNNVLYVKNSGAWISVASLQGPAGVTGPQGATGATGAIGATGATGNATQYFLKDNNGTLLGRVLLETAINFSILTSAGYFCYFYRDGSPSGLFTVCATGLNGTGQLFYSYPYPASKQISVVNGQPYIAQAYDSNGLAVSDPAITSYSSYWDGKTWTNYAVNTGSPSYPLRLAQWSEVGLPSLWPLSLPLQVVSQ